MSKLDTRLNDWQLFTFEDSGFSFPVYKQVPPGIDKPPAIVVMHEVPGIYPAVIDFAERLLREGYCVYMPSLLGEPGKDFSMPYVFGSIGKACISREFQVLALKQASPITDALRALCRLAHAECGGVGVGAIGMCLTGNFALALMVDDSVMAPVLSQPSLPFPVSAQHKRDLHVSDEQLQCIKSRVASGDVKVLGFRFSHDRSSPAERFERLREELGSGFEGIEIDSGPGNPARIPRMAHSVVTRDLVDVDGHPTQAALQRLLDFFAEQLRS
jgi:dienelactone hydrolase